MPRLPKDCAGGPSMMMLIHKICMAFNGAGNPNNVANATMNKAAKEVDN